MRQGDSLQADAKMLKTEKLKKLEESIKVYEEVIQSFEHARVRMQERRRGAIDGVMVHLDESLSLNERTLASLRRVLETAKEQVQKERAR